MAELAGRIVVRMDAAEPPGVQRGDPGRTFVVLFAGASTVELHFRTERDLRLWAKAVLGAIEDRSPTAHAPTRKSPSRKGAARARTL